MIMACFLFVAVALSALARLSWITDLFTHFTGQYVMGGFILLIVFVLYKDWLMAGLCLFLTGYSLFVVLQAYQWTKTHNYKPATLTIVQYNKFGPNENYPEIINWLETNKERFDVISIQESAQKAIDHFQALKDIYPYSFPPEKTPGTDVYLLSKIPFGSAEFIPTASKTLPSALGVHVRFGLPEEKSVSLYAIHTKVPLGARLQQVRNQEMNALGAAAAHDTSANIIMLGDWNCTPYSPHFQDLLTHTGLKNETGGLMPFPTWPSHFKLPIFQIPIDHIIYKGADIQMLRRERGPAMGSDHYPVIATFGLTQAQE